MPNAAQLARMSARQVSKMPFTCTVSSPGATTLDAFNEPVAGAPTDVVTTCGVRTPSGREVVAGGAVVSVTDVILRFPIGTNVPETAKVTRHATANDIARTYQVKAALKGRSFPTALEVLATEI